MKVKAIALGYYGKLRQPEDEFEITEDKDFSEKWMEKVEAKPAQKSGAKPAQK